MKYGLFLAAMISTGLMAQPPLPAPGTTTATPDSGAANPPQMMPPDANAPATTNAPNAKAKKSTRKKRAAKKPTAVKTAGTETNAPVNPLVPNEPAEAIKNEVNVRGQAHINSEVVGHLKRGDTVTVLEIVTLKHPKMDEPANWARIALPANMHVWVNTPYLEESNSVVKARKLNLRTGPGENYSVVGTLHKGDSVKPMDTKGSWTEIEPPTNAFGFVAAHLLSHKEAAPPPVVAAAPQPAPPTPTIVENSGTIAPPAGGTPGATAPPLPVVAPPIPQPLPPVEEPLPKRVVERDGIVGGTVSIQAPTHYELRSLDNGRVMDYLYSSSTNLVLKNYKGLTVHVSGEEELDERWPNTPVVTIQKIQVVK